MPTSSSFRATTRWVESEKKGGRPKASTATPELQDNLRRVIEDHTAGDPDRSDVTWTYLSSTEIAARLEALGTPVSPDTVRSLLDALGFHQRQAEKIKTMGETPHRNEQFEIIADLKRQYQRSPNPMVSMDTKKKEFLGELFRDGQAWANGPHAVLDHDFPSFAQGKIIPHGLYDLKRNVGHITLGTSHDTSEFACDSLRLWWQRHGVRAWPRAKSILLLCDGGGSNNCRHHIFKQDLQELVNRLGIPIRVAHYPPYCSKYNPIEHRLFPHVARAWSGVIFRTWDIVTTCLRRVSAAFLKTNPIHFENRLPEWNYTVAPTCD